MITAIPRISYTESLKKQGFTHIIMLGSFHGGGMSSKHRSLDAAKKIVDSYHKHTECICGCLYIITIDQYEAEVQEVNG